jgi:hypothetical protein
MKLFIKVLRPIGFLFLFFLLAYCSGYSYLPTSADLTKAKMQWPEADSTLIYNSYCVYKNKCGSCHFLYRPEKYNSSQWDSILPSMKKEAKLSDMELELLKKYIYVRSKDKGL